MSIAVWLTADHAGVACDWGVIEHPKPRSRWGQVGPLVLITRRYVDELMDCGGVHRIDGYEWIATEAGALFVHLRYGTRHWVWELFDAHWADGKPDDDIMVGRWPD